MSEFEKKIKYRLAKVKDIKEALSENEIKELDGLLNKIEKHREKKGKDKLEYLVISSSSPVYEEAWKLVEESYSKK